MKENRALILGLAVVVTAALTLLLFVSTSMASPSTLSTRAFAPPIPGQITYQGQLLDPTGNPVPDDQYDMVFAIYDQGTLGNTLWTQAFTGANGIQVTRGQFTAYLGGAGNPIQADILTGAPRWLGIQVGTDPEMMPRTMLTSVPYALRAETLRAGGTTSDTLASPLYTFSNPDSSGIALLAKGNVHVQGNLTWSARTGRIAVPAAAFGPGADSFTYYNNGSNLYSTYGANYVAPINLPDGATLTKVTFYYYDDTAAGDVTMTLYRYSYSLQVVYSMADVTSVDGGYGDDYDDTISYAQVDNASNSYYLKASFGTTGIDLKVQSVLVEYEYDEPY